MMTTPTTSQRTQGDDGLTVTTPSAWPQVWRPGDPLGRRQFYTGHDLRCADGTTMDQFTLAYETWGTLNAAKDNAILVLHALTGDSHVTGDAEPGHLTGGWWANMVGPGKPIDTNAFFVVAPNILGGCQGSTGPGSIATNGTPWGSRFPDLTVRDTVAAELGLADALGVARWHAVIGGSVGGMRAVEWAAMAPEKVGSLMVFASTLAANADTLGWSLPQQHAIEHDLRYHGGDYYTSTDPTGPVAGLEAARMIAHMSYRTAAELQHRFGRGPADTAKAPGAKFAVHSYLRHHGTKLRNRFDPGSYLVLTRAMDTHDVGAGRGGPAAALAATTCPALVVAVSSDRLYPPSCSEAMAAALPGAEGVVTIDSACGHDGFLVEQDQAGQAVMTFLDQL